jgi:signal transduction histidine kinase
LIAEEDYPRLEALFTQTHNGIRITGETWQLQRRDGSRCDVLVSASSVRDDNGAIIGTLAIFHDITQQKEAQRLKDDFLATASHELRTPVTTISGLTASLLRLLEKQQTIDPDQLAKRLTTIQREANRLAMLSKDLTEVSRLQTGKLTFHTEVCDINHLVEGCVNHHREVLENSGLHTIGFDPAPQPVLVMVDQARLEQVIYNLLQNALKYSPEGGTVQVVINTDETQVQVQVIDQGIGIPSDDIPKLFSPFFRASNASSSNFTGLGLGLYLSKAIVEAFNGALTVESVLGKGTKMMFSLPLNSGE